ncbi:nuclear transport factor 2 family protein [Streptomyces sp. H10-C2]|uniref:nuclear transport factor 2 family protein n=1 Tax=unclassified Streptomyces TaxID=2593676 RepID=UPI0024B9DEE9|nr:MULTISPECIES: nuclear transport factor 2 family protein [unclassified Streptomyces]MDJ0343008.1 nuclear transport factor 2 family protein [Streptomyces sp. PH10-H1]MDJ0371432.1 nuclear transport factor 2 family protein [Streptomyces sp. H10-C2]
MLSLAEISDRLEIQDLMVDYCHAVDTRQWDLLDAVFTAGAVIDYTATGGPRGTLPQIKDFLGSVMGRFPAYQHLLGNASVRLDGDTATGRTMCHNPLVLPGDQGAADGGVLYCGMWYIDAFVRVAGAWRIAERVQEKSYMHFAPAAPGEPRRPRPSRPAAG